MATRQMQCAVWYGPNNVRLEQRPVAEPRGSETLVRVVACGLCATDLHAIDGSIPLYQPPRILGHEAVGVVEAVGPQVRHVRPGDRVALDTSVPCDVCYYCHEARPFLCLDRTHTFGYLAEYTLAPARVVHRLPDDVPTDHGALAEPLSCVLHAVELAPVQAGCSAAVVGAGAIGLLTVQVLRRMGVQRLLVSDPDPDRRELALRMGATHAADPRAEDVGEVAKAITDGVGVDLAFEAVGAAATVEAAISLPRRGGTVVLVGVAPGNAQVTVRPYELFARELTIRASAMRAFEFSRAVRVLALLDIAPFVQTQIPLARLPEALELSRSRAAPKILVRP